MRSASCRVTAPRRCCRRNCSRQSSLDSRTVDGRRNPSDDQSSRVTSVTERGGADVAAATTASSASIHSTITGRRLAATPLVNGISATQISPGCGIVVEPLILRPVAVQEGTMITQCAGVVCGRFRFGIRGRGIRRTPSDGSLSLPLIQPGSQLPELLRRKSVDGSLDLFDRAHGFHTISGGRLIQGTTVAHLIPFWGRTGGRSRTWRR